MKKQKLKFIKACFFALLQQAIRHKPRKKEDRHCAGCLGKDIKLD